MNEISVNELKSRLDSGENIRVIDVRASGEFAAGHVPTAVHIPLEQVESRCADLGDGQIALICKSGGRSAMAYERISQVRGNLIQITGGTDAWMQAGFPTVQTTASRWGLERQVRLVAGSLALVGSLLAVFVHPNWVFLPMFIGAGLTFAGATDICGMAMLLAKLPWNKPTCPVTPKQNPS